MQANLLVGFKKEPICTSDVIVVKTVISTWLRVNMMRFTEFYIALTYCPWKPLKSVPSSRASASTFFVPHHRNTTTPLHSQTIPILFDSLFLHSRNTRLPSVSSIGIEKSSQSSLLLAQTPHAIPTRLPVINWSLPVVIYTFLDSERSFCIYSGGAISNRVRQHIQGTLHTPQGLYPNYGRSTPYLFPTRPNTS